jgi:hypothetical protein
MSIRRNDSSLPLSSLEIGQIHDTFIRGISVHLQLPRTRAVKAVAKSDHIRARRRASSSIS